MASNADIEQAAVRLADVVKGFRVHDGLEVIDGQAVHAWVDQMQENTDRKFAFLTELRSIYTKTYHPIERVRSHIGSLVRDRRFVGDEPAAFWNSLDVLDIQQQGSSQRDLVKLFATEVMAAYGVAIGSHSKPDRNSLYVDDGLFSGNRVVNDVTAWLAHSSKPASLTIVVLDSSNGGEFSVMIRLKSLVRVNPILSFTQTKNKSNEGGAVDVLRLRALPTDAESQAYLEAKLNGGAPTCLRGTQPNSSSLFTNETNRQLVESVFWRAGLLCLSRCPSLSGNVRPLGYCSSAGKAKLGFGSLFASYSNCPNNAPVAIWAGAPWIPLLRRRTN